MTPGGQARPELDSSHLDTRLVTRSDQLRHGKTVSPAVCRACHTTLRNPIVTLGMRDTTATRRGATGPTDREARTQQRRALTVRRGAPPAPALPARVSSSSNSTSTASRHYFYLHPDVWATGGGPGTRHRLFPCSESE